MDSKASTALLDRLSQLPDYQLLDVNVFLREEPAGGEEALALDVEAGAAIGHEDTEGPIAQMMAVAERSQRQLLSDLTAEGAQGAVTAFDLDAASIPEVSEVKSYWITNAVAAHLSVNMVRRVLEREDVLLVDLAHFSDVESLLDPHGDEEEEFDALNAGMKVGWNLRQINVPQLWKLNLTGAGVRVAVIDTGVNYKHPDLKPNMWDGGPMFPKHGYDFANGDADPIDDHGHGTACAGIVAGCGSAGGQTGVAPRATIIAIRIGGAERNYWDGIEFALRNRADVISMSSTWKYHPSPSGRPDYPAWRRICESIYQAGVAHANSSGNQGDQLGNYPIPWNIGAPGNVPPPWLHPAQPTGGVASVITCGATDPADALIASSGRGASTWQKAPYIDYPWHPPANPGLIKPDICAPGAGIPTCNWKYGIDPSAKAYSSFGGTSAATPHVAGGFCLLVEAARRVGKPVVPARMQEAVEHTAVRVAGQSRPLENGFGAGRIDLLGAYGYGRSQGWWA